MEIKQSALGLILLLSMAPQAWAATLDVNETAALEGSFGLAVIFAADTQVAWVEDDTPAGETVYRARFLMDPRPLSMTGTDRFVILLGRSDTDRRCLRLEIRTQNDKFRLLGAIKKNADGDSSWAKTNDPVDWLVIGNQPIGVMIESVYEFGGAGGGLVQVTRLDTLASTRNDGVNNGLCNIGSIRFGAAKGVDAGTTGSLYLDDFQSFRTLSPL